MLYFGIIMTTAWAVLHVYVARRLVRPMELGRWNRLFYAMLTVTFLLTPLLFARQLWPEGSLGALLRGLAWLSMGNFTVLFAFVAARDLGLLVQSVRLRLSGGAGGTADPSADEKRRGFMRLTGASAVGLTSALSGVGVVQARRKPEVVSVELPVKGLPKALDGYHIVQISDMHVGETIDSYFILPIVEQVTALKPDLVAVTGDIVDGSVESLSRDTSPLSYLRGTDGVYFVTGNHEFYSGADDWCEHFAGMGMVVLNNAHQVVERDGASLLVGGVTDYRTGARAGQPSDPIAAMEGAPECDFKLLLAHQPRSAYAAAKAGFDLQISGHTHGGQYFPWNLFVGLVQPVARGLAKIDGMWVYVNRGTGYWGPPMRTGVPAEITSLKLRRV